MLRRKILRKIYYTTLIIFFLFVISSLTINKNISNIKVEYQKKISSIYLLDDNNYLLAVNILVKDDINDNVPIIINNLKQGNKHYSGLRGIIPNNTKINKILLADGILSIDFNEELLNVNEEYEEKLIESIVYSFLTFRDIKGIKISINGKALSKLPKSNIPLDDILTKDFGINKEYIITSNKDIKKVVLYYYEEKDNNKYYVPITRYVNSNNDKIKIIIDNLKNNYLSSTNIMSYVNDKIKIENYEYENDIVTLSFANIVNFSNDKIEDEVIYTIANSILDSDIATKVIFMQNDNIITIKTK